MSDQQSEKVRVVINRNEDAGAKDASSREEVLEEIEILRDLGPARHDEIVARYRELVTADPADREILDRFMDYLGESGNTDDPVFGNLEQLYHHALEADDRNAALWGAYMRLVAVSGRYEECRAYLEEKVLGRNPYVLYCLGMVFGRSGDTGKAENFITRATRYGLGDQEMKDIAEASNYFSVIAGSHGEEREIGGMRFVYIAGGTFMMGSPNGEGSSDERPQHKVSVDGFWMGKYPVTQRQYQALMDENPSEFANNPDHPVECVNWHKAMKFCKRFSKKHDVPARLPYEAEWEYACRAGTTTRHWWGDEFHPGRAWYKDNSDGSTHPVGAEGHENPWGLSDMAGHVLEWCMDWYAGDYYSKSPEENPRGPEDGNGKCIRGGSWFINVNIVRSANRLRINPGNSYNHYGFRVVLSSR